MINQGSGQSTPVTTAFATLPRLLVTDAYNNPVPNIDVTFTAPVSGASATFAGSGSVTVQTDASGFATAATLTANATAGAFNVTATFCGGPTVNFALTNTPGSTACIAV